MALALQWAARAVRISDPNPRVGCVIVRDGRVLGAGHTQPPGQAHAEIAALRDAAARGHEVRGATAYVTLEPCNHHGRTPPCSDALVRAGLARVVAAIEDPNPLVAGQGMAKLAAHGIETRIGVLADAAYELNIGFFSRMRRGLPWVRLKTAASIDGGTALHNGQSQWITGAAARADGHAWRARAAVILSGIGTVKSDNPRLTVRLEQDGDGAAQGRHADADADSVAGAGAWAGPGAGAGSGSASGSGAGTGNQPAKEPAVGSQIDADCAPSRQPTRVIVDSRLDIALDARVLEGAPCWIVAAQPDAAKMAALRAAGHEVLLLPNPAGKVDLPALMAELGRREINEVHVEAGSKLNGSLIREGCVDELLVYLAPCLLGSAQGMFSLGPYDSLAQRQQLSFHQVVQVGADLRILARLTAAPGQAGAAVSAAVTGSAERSAAIASAADAGIADTGSADTGSASAGTAAIGPAAASPAVTSNAAASTVAASPALTSTAAASPAVTNTAATGAADRIDADTGAVGNAAAYAASTSAAAGISAAAAAGDASPGTAARAAGEGAASPFSSN